MAKTSGLGHSFHLGGVDLSGDVGVFDRIAGGNSPLEVTGINKSAPERIGGKRDGGLSFTAWFNPTGAHLTLNDLPTADTIGTYYCGLVVGNPAAAINAKQINYDPTRGDDGSLTFKVDCEGNGFGLEWGVTLAHAVQGSAGATTGLDFTASSAFGFQAYLQLLAFTGTSITVTIQESSDNAVGDPYANVTGGAFAAMTAIGAQRIATSNALTVERWLRINTTGTFSAALIEVVVMRNETAGVVF